MLTIVPSHASYSASAFLKGRSVLIVDAEGAATEFEDVLWQAGAAVLLAQNDYQAELTASCQPVSFAVLDVDLGADTLARIARFLFLRNVPYVLISATPELHPGICGPDDIIEALARLDWRRLSEAPPRRHGAVAPPRQNVDSGS